MEGQPTLLDHLYNEGRLRTISHLSSLALDSEWGPAKHRSYDEIGQENEPESSEERPRPEDN